MAVHSSVLTWRIPWTGEPGGLQSRGSQRVGRDLAIEDTHVVNLITALETSGGSGGEESACSAGDPGLIPGSIPWKRK